MVKISHRYRYEYHNSSAFLWRSFTWDFMLPDSACDTPTTFPALLGQRLRIFTCWSLWLLVCTSISGGAEFLVVHVHSFSYGSINPGAFFRVKCATRHLEAELPHLRRSFESSYCQDKCIFDSASAQRSVSSTKKHPHSERVVPESEGMITVRCPSAWRGFINIVLTASHIAGPPPLPWHTP